MCGTQDISDVTSDQRLQISILVYRNGALLVNIVIIITLLAHPGLQVEILASRLRSPTWHGEILASFGKGKKTSITL